MPARVFFNYQQYLLLGPERSLAKLAATNRPPSLSTLKRWSTRYGWANLVALHEDLIAQRISSDLIETIAARVRTDSDLISIAKRNFYDRVVLDIDQVPLSKQDRRRILSPSVLDFIRLIKLERELRQTT